jgi:hypothetical protein
MVSLICGDEREKSRYTVLSCRIQKTTLEQLKKKVSRGGAQNERRPPESSGAQTEGPLREAGPKERRPWGLGGRGGSPYRPRARAPGALLCARSWKRNEQGPGRIPEGRSRPRSLQLLRNWRRRPRSPTASCAPAGQGGRATTTPEALRSNSRSTIGEQPLNTTSFTDSARAQHASRPLARRKCIRAGAR